MLTVPEVDVDQGVTIVGLSAWRIGRQNIVAELAIVFNFPS